MNINEAPASLVSALGPAIELVQAQARTATYALERVRVNRAGEAVARHNGWDQYGRGHERVMALAFPEQPALVLNHAKVDAVRETFQPPEGEPDERTCECDECDDTACDGSCSSCEESGCEQCHGNHSCSDDECSVCYVASDCCGYCERCEECHGHVEGFHTRNAPNSEDVYCRDCDHWCERGY